MAETYRERAERGAALLDRLMPSWFKKIDLDKLDLSSCQDCICGQIARKSAIPFFRQERSKGYTYWGVATRWIRKKVGISEYDTNWDAFDHGFTANTNHGFHLLDEEWGRIVRERLEKAAQS